MEREYASCRGGLGLLLTFRTWSSGFKFNSLFGRQAIYSGDDEEVFEVVGLILRENVRSWQSAFGVTTRTPEGAGEDE